MRGSSECPPSWVMGQRYKIGQSASDKTGAAFTNTGGKTSNTSNLPQHNPTCAFLHYAKRQLIHLTIAKYHKHAKLIDLAKLTLTLHLRHLEITPKHYFPKRQYIYNTYSIMTFHSYFHFTLLFQATDRPESNNTATGWFSVLSR